MRFALALLFLLFLSPVDKAPPRRGIAPAAMPSDAAWCDWLRQEVGARAAFAWYYPSPLCDNLEFTPMVAWSPTQTVDPAAHATLYATQQSHHRALVFNECNLYTQCATDPWAAAAYFVDVLLPQARIAAAEERYIIGGATMDPCGVDWMATFAAEVRALNGGDYPPEVIGWHWHLYPDLPGPGLNWRDGWASDCPGHEPGLWNWREQVDRVAAWRVAYADDGHLFYMTELGFQYEVPESERLAWLGDVLAYLDGAGRWWSRVYYFTHVDPSKPYRNLAECAEPGCELTPLGQAYAAWKPQPPVDELFTVYVPFVRKG